MARKSSTASRMSASAARALRTFRAPCGRGPSIRRAATMGRRSRPPQPARQQRRFPRNFTREIRTPKDDLKFPGEMRRQRFHCEIHPACNVHMSAASRCCSVSLTDIVVARQASNFGSSEKACEGGGGSCGGERPKWSIINSYQRAASSWGALQREQRSSRASLAGTRRRTHARRQDCVSALLSLVRLCSVKRLHYRVQVPATHLDSRGN